MNSAASVRSRWTVVALLSAMSFMSYFDRTIMGIAGPKAIQGEFSLSRSDLGDMYTAFSLVYAVLMIPGGRFSDRLGPRRMLFIVGIGSALATALTAVAGRPGLGSMIGVYTGFILIRGLMGAFTAPLYPGCARANALWVPSEGRNLVQGLIAAAAGIGGALSPVIFNEMIQRFGWRYSFLLAGLMTAGLAFLWLWLFRDRPIVGTSTSPEVSPATAIPTTSSAPWGRLLRNRRLLLLTASYFAACYFMEIFFYLTFDYWRDARHLTDTESAWATTSVWIGWIVLSPIGGWASDRLTRRFGPRLGVRLVPVTSLVLSAACLVLGLHCESIWAAISLLSLSFGLSGAADGPYWAAAIRLGGRDVAAACGIMNTGGNLGGFGKMVTTRIVAQLGWSWGLYSAAAVMVAGALLWFFIDVTRTAGGSDPRLEDAGNAS